MSLFKKRRARKTETERVLALRAACDHDWKRVEKVTPGMYREYRGGSIPDFQSTALKYECRKCGKVEWDIVEK